MKKTIICNKVRFAPFKTSGQSTFTYQNLDAKKAVFSETGEMTEAGRKYTQELEISIENNASQLSDLMHRQFFQVLFSDDLMFNWGTLKNPVQFKNLTRETNVLILKYVREASAPVTYIDQAESELGGTGPVL